MKKLQKCSASFSGHCAHDWSVGVAVIFSGNRLYTITLPDILKAKAGSQGQTF